jgi:3-hydroxyisobutyrate dehydrogenase
MSKSQVGILGLGIMGSGMASRLLAANFSVSVYNRSAERAKPFAAAGAFVASSPAEVAARSEIVLSVVADDDASRSMWLGEKGALAGTSGTHVAVECSTLTLGWIRELASAAAQRGCEFLDAPVTGTKSHAASGELLFLVGGSEAALEKVRPVFSVLGRDVLHFGRTGNGTAMKLINNFLCGVQAASLAEAMSLIQTSGLNRAKALAVLLNGAPGSPLIKLLSSRAEAGDFTPNFELRLMAKDLAYVSKTFDGAGRGLESAKAAGALFEEAAAAGYGEQDISAVIEFLAQNRGPNTGGR